MSTLFSQDSSIAYGLSLGSPTGVISSAASINNYPDVIAVPMVPNVPSSKTFVTQAAQLNNVNASIAQVPTDNPSGTIAGAVGVFVFLAIGWLLLKKKP